MAAKKGGQVQFQMDVTTEEEWSKLLEKKGLIVADIYSDWCGPCVAMVSSLKKLKLEIGSDYLHFAIVKSDSIECLKRFRNKSEPTWMFIASGYLVNLMFGVDAPRLLQLIRQELDTELKVLNNEQERISILFDELTAEERERLSNIAAREEEKKLREQAKFAEKMKQIRRRSLKKLAKIMFNYSCILYFPHMVSADGSCLVASKMMFMYDTISVVVVDQITVQLDERAIENIFYNCNIFDTFTKSMINSMENKPVLVTLLQSIILENNAVTERKSAMACTEGYIENVLSKLVYGSENPVNYTDYSVAYEFVVENENGEKLPPMWTPTNPVSKAAALEILFSRKVEDVGYKPDELPPPQIIIIYDSSKIPEIIGLLQEYEEYVLNVGYFDSIDARNTKLLCKKYFQLKKMPDDQIKNAKMVVALRKEESDDILLEFSQVIPLYISADEKMGTEESEFFFPYDYVSEEDGKEEEVNEPVEECSQEEENNNIIQEEEGVNETMENSNITQNDGKTDYSVADQDENN